MTKWMRWTMVAFQNIPDMHGNIGFTQVTLPLGLLIIQTASGNTSKSLCTSTLPLPAAAGGYSQTHFHYSQNYRSFEWTKQTARINILWQPCHTDLYLSLSQFSSSGQLRVNTLGEMTPYYSYTYRSVASVLGQRGISISVFNLTSHFLSTRALRRSGDP